MASADQDLSYAIWAIIIVYPNLKFGAKIIEKAASGEFLFF